MFTLELIIMFHKNHFYNALVYISILAIIAMGYFDKYYMKFVLINLVISVVFDFLWIILQASVNMELFSLTGILIRLHTTRLFRLPS
jgi:hypothetical protein